MTGRGTVHEEHRGGSERDMNARGECDLFVNEQEQFPNVCFGDMGSTKKRWKIVWFAV